MGDNTTTTLQAIRRLRDKVDALESAKREPIAIVGIGCRLPGGANSPEELWQLVRDAVDTIAPVPPSRWDADAFYDPNPETVGRMSFRQGAFVDDVEGFDPYFFGISPKEAARMDPQQRLFLEVAWEAMEDAGQTRESLLGSETGVFVGANNTDYFQMQLADPESLHMYTTGGGSNSIIPNRLSYLFDFRGPSLVVDTACSSSLVAVHLAVQSLRAQESAMAVVGGTNMILSPMTTMAHAKGLPLAPDGRCKTFDAAADGYTRGEGVAVIVLKRLSDAVAAGDRVWAVIKGTATNQDGLTNGMTAPNGLAQRRVFEAALRNGGVAPEQVTLLEAHGTGTALGDPIEVEALTSVYGKQAENACALGSIKTNVGHLEAAAGITGLLKVVLSIHHREIAPHRMNQLNPHIEIDGTRLFISGELRDWDVPDEHRHGAVSAFGAGGTNAHVVLGPPPVTESTEDSAAHQILPITARSAEALVPMVAAYRDFLAAEPGSLGDIAHTATHRRTQHEHRLVVVAQDAAGAADRLTSWLDGAGGPGIVTGNTAAPVESGIVFVCPGQGAQRPGMGHELMARCDAFRTAVLECDEALKPYQGGKSVVDEILRVDAAELADRIDLTQPALFAVTVGLAARWRALGIEPDAVVGHSLGEVAAAHISGALSLDDAARIVSLRSTLLRTLSGKGAMLVVALPIEEATALVAGHEGLVSVAVSNSPASTVLSGDPATLDALAEELKARNVFCRPMKSDVAGHSPQLDALRDELLAGLADIRPAAAHVPLFSTVTGGRLNGEELRAEHWFRNLRQPVLFWNAIRQLVDDKHGVFLELGPHPVVLNSVEEAFEQAGVTGLALPSMRRDEPEDLASLESLGSLHAHGFDVSLSNSDSGSVVALPLYAWQRERYWFTSTAPTAPSVSGSAPAQEITIVQQRSPEPPAATEEDVFAFVLDTVAELLEMDRARIDPNTGFFQMGMDSLVARKARQRAEAALDLKLPAAVMFEHPSVMQLTKYLLARLSGESPSAAPPSDIDDLTEDELLAVLADELGTTTGTTGSIR
ncbi:type I polyketide synthase [Lentzea sp. NPDC051213]|uniref:type I polyketide synthase n=1 Tax=Lentzea sp. NPDC051213 TaxID=3364126 RepID=UPI00378CEF11